MMIALCWTHWSKLVADTHTKNFDEASVYNCHQNRRGSEKMRDHCLLKLLSKLQTDYLHG